MNNSSLALIPIPAGERRPAANGVRFPAASLFITHPRYPSEEVICLGYPFGAALESAVVLLDARGSQRECLNRFCDQSPTGNPACGGEGGENRDVTLGVSISTREATPMRGAISHWAAGIRGDQAARRN